MPPQQQPQVVYLPQVPYSANTQAYPPEDSMSPRYMSSRNLRQEGERERYEDSYSTAPLKKKSTRKRLPEGRKGTNATENVHVRLPDLNNPS